MIWEIHVDDLTDEFGDCITAGECGLGGPGCRPSCSH